MRRSIVRTRFQGRLANVLVARACQGHLVFQGYFGLFQGYYAWPSIEGRLPGIVEAFGEERR
ncbi:hypothetical protein OVY35_24470, partial [Salmonella enterica subsp. enterica serovar 1,4,[5],12:i:-]|nr:hypothetical protein [Salmonella enterica subsp. enterica serovar 1,4,[5],12:i:-]